MAKIDASTVDAYIAAHPLTARRVLEKVRETLRRALPGAEEIISYKIPAYRLHGRIVIYFAGWKQHYAIYPVGEQLVGLFAKELAPYELSHKGTVRFPFDGTVPIKLIEDIAKFRAREIAEGRGAKLAVEKRAAATRKAPTKKAPAAKSVKRKGHAPRRPRSAP